MKLASVLLARALAFVETFDLDPRGAIFYPELITALVQRYQFQKFPERFADVDETKGIEFFEGKTEKIVIQKVTIFNSLLVLETRSNTNDSKAAIENILQWTKERFGLHPRPDAIRHWAYVSNLSFTTDIPILSTMPLENLARKTERVVSELWKDESIKYHTLMTGLGIDPLTRKNPIAAFTLQRRAETPFTDNKYFSESPLPTDLHIKFLEEFENDVLLAVPQEARKSD